MDPVEDVLTEGDSSSLPARCRVSATFLAATMIFTRSFSVSGSTLEGFGALDGGRAHTPSPYHLGGDGRLQGLASRPAYTQGALDRFPWPPARSSLFAPAP